MTSDENDYVLSFTKMLTKRVFVIIALTSLLALVAPLALLLVRVDRNELDSSDRLEELRKLFEKPSEGRCITSESCIAQKITGDSAFGPGLVARFDLRLLVEGTRCNISEWNMLVTETNDALKAIGKSLGIPVTTESSVMFHANTQLLLDGAIVSVDAVKRSLHRIVDEADVGGSSSPASTILMATCSPSLTNRSSHRSYRIPGWGVLSLVNPLSESRQLFVSYAQTAIFDLPSLTSSDIEKARIRALMRGIAHVILTLNATKTLATSLPHLPVPHFVSKPFEECLDLIENIIKGNDVPIEQALASVRRAVQLADDISAEPSLIPELYMSEQNLLAVFAPMILPTLMPLMLGILTELKKSLVRRRSTK